MLRRPRRQVLQLIRVCAPRMLWPVVVKSYRTHDVMERRQEATAAHTGIWHLPDPQDLRFYDGVDVRADLIPTTKDGTDGMYLLK